jgi:hypothetical protein
VGNLLNDRGQLMKRGLEQLVARVGLEHVHDRLAAMTVLAVTGKLNNASGLLP